MEYQDRQITCADCAQAFVFSAGEQEFYARKGFKEEPKRCKPCRDVRKARREGGGPPPFTTRGNSNARYGNGSLAGGSVAGAGFGGGGGAGGMSADLDDDIGNRIDAPLRPGAAHGPREVRDVRGRAG